MSQRILAKLFDTSIEHQLKQILWRKVEQMSPWARCILFGRTILPTIWYEREKVWPTAVRTPLYVAVANAFYNSHEWRGFRSDFLLARPVCEFASCKHDAQVVHHVPPNNVAATIIGEGLLWVLDEDISTTQRLKALCYKHHQLVHGL